MSFYWMDSHSHTPFIQKGVKIYPTPLLFMGHSYYETKLYPWSSAFSWKVIKIYLTLLLFIGHSYYETKPYPYPWLIQATYFSGKSVSMQCSLYFCKRSMLYNTYTVLGVTASGWECNSTQRRCLILSRLISSGREIAVVMKWSSIEWICTILWFFLVKHRDLVCTSANRSRKHHRVQVNIIWLEILSNKLPQRHVCYSHYQQSLTLSWN